MSRKVTRNFSVTRREAKVGKYGDRIIQIENRMKVDGAEIEAKPMMQCSAEREMLPCPALKVGKYGDMIVQIENRMKVDGAEIEKCCQVRH